MIDFKHIFDETDTKERVAKRLARTGLCSRREAERWIADGRVLVDGLTIESPAITVTNGNTIFVDGKPIPVKEKTRLWRYHKPKGQITSNNDIRDRATIFDHLPKEMPRVMSVGRLDFDSEGLLLLTNNGELSRLLELPSTKWVRRYRVRVHGRPQSKHLEHLKTGVTIDGIKYRPIYIHLDKQNISNAWLTIGLREGKNREIRKLMESIELKVNRLIRTAFGPFQLGNLNSGSVEEVRQNSLKKQLGVSTSSREQKRTRVVNKDGTKAKQ